jgi:hypothetical protein
MKLCGAGLLRFGQKAFLSDDHAVTPVCGKRV